MKKKQMLVGICCLGLQVLLSQCASSGFIKSDNGIVIDSRDSRLLSVEFVKHDIVRLQYSKEKELSDNKTGVCLPRQKENINFKLKKKNGILSLASDSLIVNVNLKTYAVEYIDKMTGKLLLSENTTLPREAEKVYIENVTYDENSKRIIKSADGEKVIKDVLKRDTIGVSWKYRNNFNWTDKEALYGLGSHMEDYMNLRGKELFLIQHNLKEVIPVLNSTAGYGLMFDAGCGMIFRDNDEGHYMELEAAKEMDYYFMKGASMDKVIARYRDLTGNSPMMPRYMFGYIQSKEHYKTSKEVINTVAEYRKRKIPLDMIVQDWNYWPGASWGYMKMDSTRYPSPKNLADSVHAMNAKLMVSIWPNPGNCPEGDEFMAKKLLIKNMAYDVFKPEARSIYWKYANNEFFKNGFDAWWCDCSEPLDADWKVMPNNYGWNNHKERWESSLNILNELLGAERANLYSLYHAKGIYENQRLTSNEKRVVNLTRSSYAGQQRYSTITWNGDTHASWESFARQIPAGLNFMAAGLPYWTVDIGTFFVKKDPRWFWDGNYEKGVDDMGYREFYTRMFQYGAFLPMFRSHGTDTPREVWQFGEKGTMFYESLVKTINLRYKLLPYIYSLAGEVTQKDYTMCRMLAFDFANDKKVLDIKDELMLGNSLLVAPVTKPMYYDKGSVKLQGVEKVRNVYLPDGTAWYDYWTGKLYDGGVTIKADATIDKIPLFIRQGSIIPMGKAVQYTEEQTGKELDIHVYGGRNAEFTLYQDSGDGYQYEKGNYAMIQMHWDDKSRTLTIDSQEGTYNAGKIQQMKVLLFGADSLKPISEKEISYDGKAKVVKL